jgi:hypothetical protein
MDRFHLQTLLASVPGLITSKQQRALLREMRSFDRLLPGELEGPLPSAIESLTPALNTGRPGAREQRLIRRLGDIAILLNGASGLGPCVRRSLLRFHYLRRTGLPVTINFGARMVDGKPDRAIAGHAWLTLDSVPYHEASEDWRGFEVMVSFP